MGLNIAPIKSLNTNSIIIEQLLHFKIFPPLNGPHLFLGDFHIFAFFSGSYLKNNESCKNEFQIEILHSKIVLCVEFDRNQMIFISLYFLWSYLTSMQKQISDSNSTPQNVARYQISSKSGDFHIFLFLIVSLPLQGLYCPYLTSVSPPKYYNF